MQLDHVLFAVARSSTPRLPRQYGLEPYEDGRHPGWGTANWIVPLGDASVELVAVVDEDEARGSAFGRWWPRPCAPVAGRSGGRFARTNLDASAARPGLHIADGSRTTPVGEREWRSAGIEEAARSALVLEGAGGVVTLARPSRV